MLRVAFITATLDAGVPLRDVQLATQHAGPRTTTIYDRGRQTSRHSGVGPDGAQVERACRPLRSDSDAWHRGMLDAWGRRPLLP